MLARSTLLGALLTMAAALASAAPAVLAPSQFNDTAVVDSAVLGTRIPVLLVHGLGGSTEGWESFLQAYARNPAWRAAFKPYTFSYSTTTADVDADPAAPRTLRAVGASLRDVMQAYYDKPVAAPDFGFGNKRVIVLAHSMGGLVARSMMQEYTFRDGQRGGQKVLHLITLGTPHHGSQMADAAGTIGLQTVAELSETYTGFINDLNWTNFDGLDMSSGRCNPWLAQLNNYAPSTGAHYGRCGTVAASPLPGFYEKIIAYGVSELQSLDLQLGVGVFKPGSSPALLLSYNYLRSGLSRPYPNDGIVPITSAQFDGPVLWRRGEAFACDHRFIKRGYPRVVKTWTSTYSDWAFCAASPNQAGYASGTAGGYAVSGTIFGVAGGIIDTIKNASEAERIFNWVEQAYAGYLQPAGATSEIHSGYYYRHYPSSQAYVGVKDGSVYYSGPASERQVVPIASVTDFLAQAQAAGF